MNELSLFELSEPELKTTKDLSKMFDVSTDTILRAANKVLDPGSVLRRVINGGESRVFTEEQATLIMQEIQKHHNLSSRQIDSVSTDYEMELLTQKVLMYHVQKAAEYKQRAEVAEKALMRIEHAPGCFSLSQTAKALKLPYGRNTLNDKLKEMKIFMQSGEPYQEYISTGHFKVVTKHTPIGLKTVTLATGKGLVYLAKKLAAEIDESILPDEA